MSNKKQSSYQILKNEHMELKKQFESAINSINIKKQKKPYNNNLGETIPWIQTLFRIRQDISTFRNAMLRAENKHNPNRLELYRTYQQIMLDPHLSACIQNRKSAILSADFIVVDKKGKEVEELTQLMQNKWFFDALNLILDSIYFGFSVIEFDNLENNIFHSVDLIPREYVKSEFGIVGKSTADLTGASWLDPEYSGWAIGVGEKTNLGLLAKCAMPVIYKMGAIEAYAEFTQTMGIPLKVMKTDAFGEDRNAAENALRNFGMAPYILIDPSDTLEFVESKQAAGVEQMFNGLINTMNEEISKVILDGTGAMEAKSFVGSAQIHQDNFDMICEQDKMLVENVLKLQLVPMLLKRGFPLQNMTIKIKADEELDLAEKFKIDSELLKYYKIPAAYINETYGTCVEDMVAPEEPKTTEQPESQENNAEDTTKLDDNE